MGVNETWVALFQENERRFREAGNKPRPRTDREITLFLLQEFPHKNSEVYRRVSTARYRYNNCQLYKDQTPPRQKSYRYSTKGERIPARFFDAYEERG